MARKPHHEIPRFGAEGFALTMHEVNKAFKARMDERLKPLGLSNATRNVVCALSCAQAPLSQRELADAISIEGPTLVRLLDRLEEMGWARREPVPGDRRVKHVQLTDKAEPFLDEVVETAISIQREILDGIPEEDIRTAHELLLKLRDRLWGMEPEKKG